MGKNWIAGAIKRKGGLHHSMGVPQGQKLSVSSIRKAAKKKGLIGRQANLALTLRGMRHGR